MSSSVASFRPGRTGLAGPAELLAPARERERSALRRIRIAWGLLVLDVMTFFPGGLLPIPSVVGKGIAQGALPMALLLILSVNRRILIRPNMFLCLVSLLLVGAIIASLRPQYVGTIYRTFRLAEFLAALWLLTPWWGRRDLLLIRSHVKALTVALATVVLGLLVAPGASFGDGRLGGVLWPIPPPQVAHYAAVVMGLEVVLWLSGQQRGRVALLVTVVGGAMLLLTHTRTGLIGMIAGILIAGLSLVVARARARRLFAIGGVVVAIVIMTLSGIITTWLARGQGTQEITQLTGRTKVWGALVAFPRDRFQEIFGFGLSNSSFNGLPIDSNWLASYQEQGLFAVGVCATILIFLLVAAYFQPRGANRALALFLVTYCLVASFTEVGFTDASSYLLELTLAASLLVPSAAREEADMTVGLADPGPPQQWRTGLQRPRS